MSAEGESGCARAASGKIRMEAALADERYVVMTVECQRCKTKQKVHIAARTGGAQMGDQTILCLNCNNSFKVTIRDKIIRGPFPV